MCDQPLATVQGYGMTYELHNVQSEIKVTEEISGCGLVRVYVLMCARFSHVKVLDEKQQLPEPPLVKHAHQI